MWGSLLTTALLIAYAQQPPLQQQQAAAAPASTTSSKPLYQSPLHSIYRGEVVPRAWVSHNVQLSHLHSDSPSEPVELSRRDSSKSSYLFNRYPISQPGWELQFELTVVGPPEAKSADGFAVWLVQEHDPSIFYRPADKFVWSFYGYRPRYTGFAVFFASNDRTNQPTASISTAYNNGSKTWDMTGQVPSAEGIYYNYRNHAQPISVRLIMQSDQFKGMVKGAADKDWKTAFTSKVNPDVWKSGGPYYLGFSASNRRVPPGDTVPPVNQGDAVSLNNIRLLVEDPHFVTKNESPGQDVLRKLSANESADTAALIKAVSEVLERYLVPQQEHMLAQLAQLESRQQMTGERLDILHAYLTKGSLDPELKKAVENMGTVLNRQNSRLAELKGKLETSGVKELQERSASLEETIKSHAQWSSTLTIALGGVFVIFGVVIYKRMRDMEKKHIL